MPRSLVRFLTSAASTALLAVVATSALSGDYAIAVPRAVTPEQGRLLHEVVTDLALSDAVASDEIRVVDATTGTTIAVFAVPDDGREEVPNLRRRALAEPLADWTRFVREHLVEGSPSSEIGAIDLPRILAALGQAYADRDPATRELCVLVAGSPLRPDATEPAFDMTQAPLVPSDGLIAGPLNASPFGTADRQGQLRGMRVAFWAFDPPGGWDTGLHEQRVERAWWLHTTAQGGTMTAYGPDADTVLQRFADCEDAPTRTFAWDDTRRVNAMIDPNRSTEVTEEKAEMAPAMEEAAADAVPAIELSDEDLGNEDWLRDVDVMLTDVPLAMTRLRDVRVGIRWGDDGRCAGSDLDLYLAPDSVEPFLYFSNEVTDHGTFAKDHRSAPEVENGLEYATLIEEVDLGNLRILLNHYEGDCPGGPRGVVRGYAGGSVFELPFHVGAERGDRGRNMNASDDPHWLRIDPRQLFQLD